MAATQPGRASLAAIALCAALGCAAPSDAGVLSVTGTPTPWLSVGLLTGTTRFDPHLADYQWKVDLKPAWGAQAIAGIGRFGIGPRLWQSQTNQHIELASTPDPKVRSTRLDLVGRGRLLSRWGTDFELIASTGWLRLGYAPEHVAIPSSGGGSIDVALGPVDSWSSGAGFAMRRGLIGSWAAGVEVESQMYAMDTAHRSGSSIVTRRERFSEWSARFELARVYGRR